MNQADAINFLIDVDLWLPKHRFVILPTKNDWWHIGQRNEISGSLFLYWIGPDRKRAFRCDQVTIEDEIYLHAWYYDIFRGIRNMESVHSLHKDDKDGIDNYILDSFYSFEKF